MLTKFTYEFRWGVLTLMHFTLMLSRIVSSMWGKGYCISLVRLLVLLQRWSYNQKMDYMNSNTNHNSSCSIFITLNDLSYRGASFVSCFVTTYPTRSGFCYAFRSTLWGNCNPTTCSFLTCTFGCFA